MTLPERSYTSGSGYRFGFQGQETDDEVNGKGNSVYFKYRVHDPRIGRFASIDPLAKDYAFNSPYAFSQNRVIDGVELEGAEFDIPDYLKEQGENLLRNATEYLLEQSIVVAQDAANGQVDKYASRALINHAKGIDENVSTYSEKEKTEIFKTDADKTRAIFLYEFATGEGPSERTFGIEHAFTRELLNGGYLFKETVKEFEANAKLTTLNQFVNKGSYTEVEFSPDDAGVLQSLRKHIISNKSEFIVGGVMVNFSYTGLQTNEEHVAGAGKYIINVKITNNMTRKSLLLHLGKNYDAEDVEVSPLSSKRQMFEFGILFDPNDFKEHDNFEDPSITYPNK